jgi:hypothetical protein
MGVIATEPGSGVDERLARQFRDAILNAAREHGVPTEVLVAACADVVAATAARQDAQGDRRFMPVRMALFNTRVEHTYTQELATQTTRPRFRG